MNLDKTLIVGLLSLALTACGGGPAEQTQPQTDAGTDASLDAGPDTDAGETRYSCQRTDAAVRGETCRQDDDCACGSHCAWGTCRSECASDADCDGADHCDEFGRCRQDGNHETTRLTTTSSNEPLIWAPSALAFPSPGATKRLRVFANDAETDQVVVFASQSTEVSCDGGSTFAASCSHADIGTGNTAAGVITSVRRRPGALPVPGSAEQLTLATRHREFLVSVLFPEDAPPSDQPPAGAGIYRGRAVVTAAGFSSRAPLPARGEVAKLSVPVQIRVGEDGGGYLVELSDRAGIVFPGGDDATLASLQADGQSWRLNAPSYLHVGEAVAQPGEIQITADFNAPSVTWNGDSLSFVGQTTYHGVTLEGSAPYVRWRVLAVREDDFDGFLGPLPEPVELTQAPAQRAQTPVPAEDGFNPNPAALSHYDGATSFARAGVVLCSTRDGSPTELSNTLLGDGTSDVACAGSIAMKGMPVLDVARFEAGKELDTCYQELAASHDVDDSLECIDAERMRAAIALGLEDTRSRALGQFRAAPEQGARLATYLLGQWFGVQSFVANQYHAVNRYNDVFSKVDENDSGDQITIAAQPGALLERLNATWDVVLHPRYGAAWGLAPEFALVRPDYRTAVVGSGVLPGPQQGAAPVVIARGIDAHLELTDSLISRVQFDLADFDSLRPKVTRSLRQSVITFAIARGLVDDASVIETPAWLDDWRITRDSMARTLNQTVGNLLDGQQLLGVTEADLPLYGLDDQESDTDRALAVSYFLLGKGADVGVADDFVDRAYAKLADARTAYTNFKTFEYRDTLNANQKTARIKDIRSDYGGQIASLCNPAWTSFEVLDFDASKLDPETCFLREQSATGQACRLEDDQLYERLTAGGVLTSMCVARSMLDRYGKAASSGDADFDQLIASMPRNGLSQAAIAEAQQDGKVLLSADGWQLPDGTAVDLQKLEQIIANSSASGSGDFLTETRLKCTTQYGEGFGRPAQPPDSCEFTSDCPLGYVCNQGACTPELDSPADDPTCYRGQLGQMALQVRQTATDIDIANSDLKEYSEQYHNAMRTCIITQLGNDEKEDTLTSHNDTMDDWATGKLAAQVAANVAQAGKDCASNGAWSDITGKTVVICAAALAEATAESVVDGLDFKMERLQRNHEETMLEIENAIENQTCFNDAQAHLIGIRSATLRIKRARQELAQQLVEFQDMKTTVDGLVFEGRDALRREASRTINPLAMDFWIDEYIARYDRYFRIARRALYLAMLAVEYELQLTYPDRHRILSARTQKELADARVSLTNYLLPGRIPAASSPDGGVAVLSLKHDLLGIGDRSNFPDGQHRLNAEQRLQVALTNPEHAVYDESGNFKGVEIPFSLAPGGQQDITSVPILSGRTCAERLWSVNASIQGENLIRGSETHIRQLEIRKRNTFFSQWCSAAGEDEEYQFASVRPSRNLFLDPRAQNDSNSTRVDNFGGEPVQFAKASVNSYINVPRAELEDEAYFNGDSNALAGRGIYGDYKLFIPADALAVSDDDSGLVLSRVDDILIRFDYVAALKN